MTCQAGTLGKDRGSGDEGDSVTSQCFVQFCKPTRLLLFQNCGGTKG